MTQLIVKGPLGCPYVVLMPSYCASRLLIIITRTHALNVNHYNEATWKAHLDSQRSISNIPLKHWTSKAVGGSVKS